jgi:hypothetical protein
MNGIRESLAHIRNEQADALDRMKELGARIRSGESSGDAILDFLIVFGGSYILRGKHEPIERAYRELAERLKGKAGQPLLMIERNVVTDLRDSTGKRTQLLERCTLGVLKDDQIVFCLDGTKPCWTFSTDRFAKRGDLLVKDWCVDTVHVIDGAMHPSEELLYHERIAQIESATSLVSLALISLGLGTGWPITELVLVIGNKEIEAWCRNNPFNMPSSPMIPYLHTKRTELVWDLMRALGIDPQGISAVAQYKRQRMRQTLERLNALTQTLRAANEELGKCTSPDRGAELGRTITDVRMNIQKTLAEAENLEIDDPFVLRLRAAHPAT